MLAFSMIKSKPKITVDIGQIYGGCPYQSYKRHNAYSGKHSTFYAEWGNLLYPT